MDLANADLPMSANARHLLFVLTPKGVHAADEMLRIANNLQRG